MNAPSLVVWDVGNTALKVVAFGPRGAVRGALRVPLRVPLGNGARPEVLAACLREFDRPSVVVSVNDAGLVLLEGALGLPPVPLLGRDLPVVAENRTDAPAETGIDRLCAAAAAHARARGAAVAVGVGTALTVDAVDGTGAFLGGAIGPGLPTTAAGHAPAAPRLPSPDFSPGAPAGYPGRTTAGALRAGFLLGFAGAVDRLAAEASRAAAGGRLPRRRGGGRVPVFLHGGDAPLLIPHLGTAGIHAPHLVAEGARVMLLRG